MKAPSRSCARTTAGPAARTPHRPTFSSNPTARCSPAESQHSIGLAFVRNRSVLWRTQLDTGGGAAVADGDDRAHALTLQSALAVQLQLAVERERHAHERDAEEHHERRGEHREVGAAEGERRRSARSRRAPCRREDAARGDSVIVGRGRGRTARDSCRGSRAPRPPASTRWIHSSGRSMILCASAGRAIRLTSSGVTKSRPSSPALARASLSSASVPRGLDPTCTWGLSRVAVTRSTAYSRIAVSACTCSTARCIASSCSRSTIVRSSTSSWPRSSRRASSSSSASRSG